MGADCPTHTMCQGKAVISSSLPNLPYPKMVGPAGIMTRQQQCA